MSKYRGFLREQLSLGKPTWSPEEIPDMSGRVAIVTGGTSGLGLDTVRALLKRNAKVYIAARNEQKAAAVIQALVKETGKTAMFLKLELSDMRSVYDAAEEIKGKEKRLDILYNNAGVWNISGPQQTLEGWDMTFTTNVIGPFYFTKLLMPLLLSTADGATKGTVRIINVSSAGHHIVRRKPMDYSLLRGPKAGTETPEYLYSLSKFALILLSNAWAKRYGSKGVVSIALHPGTFETPMVTQHAWPMLMLLKFLARYPLHWASYTQLWAGTESAAGELNGQYVVPWGREGIPRKEVYDEKLINELWEWLEDRIKEYHDKPEDGSE